MIKFYVDNQCMKCWIYERDDSYTECLQVLDGDPYDVSFIGGGGGFQVRVVKSHIVYDWIKWDI